MPGGVEGSERTLVGGMGQTLLLDGRPRLRLRRLQPHRRGYALEQGRLSFEPLASTPMACEPSVMQAESDFVADLERTVHASLADGGSSSPPPPAPSYSASP